MVIWHLKQIGKVKELDDWVTHKLTTNQKQKQKITVLKCCSSFIVCNNKPFLDQIVTCKEKWILRENNNKQLSAWTKKKLQSSSQKRSSSLFGGLLLVWSTTAFWILVKPLHLRSMLSKSMRYTKNYNACSQHWSTEWAQFFSMTMPDHMSYNQLLKVEWIGLWSFASSIVFTRPHVNLRPLLQASWQLFVRKTLSKCSTNPKAWILMVQE